MPIYEFSCKKCGEVTEVLVIGKSETPACKQCGSEDVVKLISAANVNAGSPSFSPSERPGGCCGSPNSCGAPGSCCSG